MSSALPPGTYFFAAVVRMRRLIKGKMALRRGRLLGIAVFSAVVAMVCAAAPWVHSEWKFRNHLRVARIAFEQRVADNAVIELQDAEKLRPDSAEVQYLLGVANRKAGHLDDCRPHFNRARELGWPEKVIRFQLLLLAFQAGDRDAEAGIKQLMALPMTDDVAEDTYEALAVGYLSDYRISSAGTVIDHWLSWRPKRVRPLLLRAEIFGASRRYHEQLAQYEEVLAIEPDNYAAHLGRAHGLLDEHKVEPAMEEYRWCGEQWRADVSPPLGMAACYQHQGKMEQAALVLDELLQRQLRRDERAHITGELGKLRQQMGELEKAISLLTQSVELNPYDVQNEYALALSLARAGRADEAKQHSDRSKELEKLKQRLADVELVMLNQPSDIESRYEAGLLLAELGNPKAAAAMMLALLRWDPRHAGAHAELAKYYHDIGRDDLARKYEELTVQVVGTEAPDERGGG